VRKREPSHRENRRVRAWGKRAAILQTALQKGEKGSRREKDRRRGEYSLLS